MLYMYIDRRYMGSPYYFHRFASRRWRKSIKNILKTNRDILKNFYDRPSLLSCPGRPLFPGVLIFPITPKALIVIGILFGSQVLCFLRGRCWELLESVENYWSFTRCQVLHPVREGSNLTRGLRGHLLKTIASKEDRALLRILRWKSFLSASRISEELICQFGRTVVVRTAQGRLVANRSHPRHPDRCLWLAPDHRCHHRLLANRRQIWNHQHLSHTIFDDESRVSLYHSVVSSMQQSTSLSTIWRKSRGCPLQL